MATNTHTLMQCVSCFSVQNSLTYIKDGYPIIRCKQCGLGWVDKSVVASTNLGAIYGHEYFSGGRYIDYAASEEVLRREFRSTVKGIVKRVPTGRLLEIGCAYGFFLMEASAYFDCIGLELCEAAVAACRARQLNVQQGAAEPDNIGQAGPFDVVVLLDVIEHLPTPELTLQGIWECLNPGGIVVMTTGDWSSLLARLMGPRWRLMTPPHHLYYFSPSSLTQLLRGIGFVNVEVSRPWKFVPIGLILFQLRRFIGIPKLFQVDFLNKLGIYLNLFDSFRIIAQKPP